jgi:prophage regulatory protein
MSPDSPNFYDSAPTVVIDRAEVLLRTGLKKSTMYTLIKRGEFVRQIQLTDATVGWNSAEVEDWIQRRMALRYAQRATVPLGANEVPAIKAQYVGCSQSDGGPTKCWPVILNGQKVKKLTGQELTQMRAGNTQPFYDSATGRLWVCVLQIDLQNPPPPNATP